VSENPPPGLDEIHGSLTAPLLPSLDASDVLGASAGREVPEAPLTPRNPTLPTLSWDPASSTTSSMPPQPPTPQPPASQPLAQPGVPAPPQPASAAATPIPGVPPASVPDVPAAPAPVAAVPPTPVSAVPPAPVTPPTAVHAPLVPEVAAQSASAPAPTVPAPAVAAAPVPPHVAAVPPAVAALPVPPGAMPGLDLPGVPPAAGQLPSHRGRDAFGAIVRTLVIAALVAAAVFGGRAAWDWNEGRHETQAGDVLPAEELAALPVQSVTFVRDVNGTGQMVAAVDLSTGDYLLGVGAIEVARHEGMLYQQVLGEPGWVPTNEEALASSSSALARAEAAFLVMISDLLPVESHPYLTIVSDESVELPGSPVPGAEVIEIASVEGPPEVDEIRTSGDSDVILDDVIDDIASPTYGGETGSAYSGPLVPTRHLTITLDRAAFSAGEPGTAYEYGLGGTTPVEIEVWVDSTGVLRKMIAPADVGRLGQYYELLAAPVDGPGIFDGSDFAPPPPAPTDAEVSE